MKRIPAFILLCCLAFALSVNGAAAENENRASIRDMMMTEKKAFSFRNGVAWGMNPQQVSLTEEIPMEKRSSPDWSVMITAEPVKVSRYTADLVYMFYQDALRMITYEFRTDCTTLNYQYLTGALCSVYGEGSEASPAEIKRWMDLVYQDYYQEERIRQALKWTSEDGTRIFLYYFTETTYAILYVCPASNGGGGGYETNGL